MKMSFVCRCGWVGDSPKNIYVNYGNDADIEQICPVCNSSGLDLLDTQRTLTKEFYLNSIDFKDWVRYYYIVKTAIELKPCRTLEIGVGNKVVNNVLHEITEYWTMDINDNLNPNYVSDIRDYNGEFAGNFDLIICSEILEHIPWNDINKALLNLYRYLKQGGSLLITVPHHKPYIMTSTIANVEPNTVAFPKFRNFETTDPYHRWEIGKYRKVEDLERKFTGCGFSVIKRTHIPWHEFWELKSL